MVSVGIANPVLPADSRMLRIALSALTLLMLMSAVPASTLAQTGTEGDPYKSEILEWNISVSGPNYVLEDVALEEYPHGRGERLYVSSVDSLGFVELSFFDDSDSPGQTIEIMLRDFESASESFTLLESGDEEGVFYALARFDIDQSLTGYFYIEVVQDIEGTVDFSQSIYTLNTDFLKQLEIARDEIDMNGLAFMSSPVIDLNATIAADEAATTSTPEHIATPQTGEYTFASGPATLSVQAPIALDFPYSTSDLDVKFLASPNGFGVVGYILQESDSAEAVIDGVFVGAPSDATAPMELYLDDDDDRALGVYRIEVEGDIRAMVIEVHRVNDSLWTVEAMAVTESEFATELEGYQQGVAFDGIPFLNDIEPEDILSVLN